MTNRANLSEKPRLLDLFCGGGGAGVGYHRAGFDVVGVDIAEQPEYPFEFIRADALTLDPAFAGSFDAIHASPPCQHFTKYRNVRKDLHERYEDLVEPTRQVLKASGRPYAIENVVGAPIDRGLTLCGSMFGLDVQRHRLFETSIFMLQPPCDHSVWEPNRFPGGRSRERGHARLPVRATVEVGRWNIPIATQLAAMGIDWISDLRMLSESIPPAYTQFIGAQLLAHLQTKRLAA